MYEKYLLDDKNWYKDLSPSTELKIEEENNECQVLSFILYYDPEFDVKNNFVTNPDLVYDVNRNKDNIFEEHLFKSIDVLLNVYCRATKSLWK